MIYRNRLLKDLSLTSASVFVALLAILTASRMVNLIGRVAGGRIPLDAVLTLSGFLMISMVPLLLILTAYISTLTVLTRYWRDSEMSVWLSCGLPLKNWCGPILRFCIPLAILSAIMTLSVVPWVEAKSQEFSEILKQKQELELIEPGIFREIGGQNARVYFLETFKKGEGVAENLFIREQGQSGEESVILAKQGLFQSPEAGLTKLLLQNGYRYTFSPQRGTFERASFESLELNVFSSTPVIKPTHVKTINSVALWQSDKPKEKAELMWRVSLPISLILLSLLALPLSYYNPRSGHSYHVLFAVGLFLFYQNTLTFFNHAAAKGQIAPLLATLPAHGFMLLLFLILLKKRSNPNAIRWLFFWQK